MNLSFKLHVSILREGSKFIAYAPALDLSTSASSLGKAKKRFGEIVTLFFEECKKKGVLGEVLLDLGWQKTAVKSREKWIPPLVIDQQFQTFTVPTA